MILKIGGKRKVIKVKDFLKGQPRKKRYLLYAMYEGNKSKSLVAVLHYLGLEVVEEALRRKEYSSVSSEL